MNFLDTSVIILFSDYINHISCINQLHKLGKDLKISKSVHDEYYHNTSLWLSDDQLKRDIDDKKIIVIKRDLSENIRKLYLRYPQLHEGELSIIALGILCKNLSKEYICVIDDKKARKVATTLNLNLTGSIGLIKFIKEKNRWSHECTSKVINEIDLSPFHVSEEILGELFNG